MRAIFVLLLLESSQSSLSCKLDPSEGLDLEKTLAEYQGLLDIMLVQIYV